MADAKVALNPQPLPPRADSPAWWPQLLWELHRVKGPGIGPINYPPAVDDIMAALHIHTMSYLLQDQAAAQQIRSVTEQRLAHAVQHLSKGHDDAVKAASNKR